MDWPIEYADIKPYYELLELEMPVAGPAYYPWGHPHGYAYGPHPMGGVGETLIKSCTALNTPVSIGGPVAFLSGSHGDRPHCIYRGFCIQGCKVGAKASSLVTHVPDAVVKGAAIRSFSMVSRVELGRNNRVTGVHYFDKDGDELERRAWQIPDGKGRQRGDGPVRRAGAHVQGAARACADREVLQTNPKNDFARGSAIQTVGPLPAAFGKQMLAARKAWAGACAGK